MIDFSRRRLLRNAANLGGGLALSSMLPSWARSATFGLAPTAPALTGNAIDLTISHAHRHVDGRAGHVVAVNGTVPGPLLRLKEGQNVRLSVKNELSEETSIHWHGVLLPFQMDGVPGVTFPGIKPGETFVYEFPVIQSGTYWYHSHSGLQEQEGHYGPIVIDPAGEDPIRADREHVVVLSDFSFMHPHLIFERLKLDAEYFNYQQETVAGLLTGKDQTLKERAEWAKMLMNPTDISDVTGAAYTFLINGHGARDNWTGLFKPGERVRLRFINSAAQTMFDVRVPGLKISVVAADGQNVRPVEVDEFQIGNAETYDVIVEPSEDRAFTLVAEAVDRSGMARGTLAPRTGMTAPVPPLRNRPLASMKDMGMDMGAMTMGGGAASSGGMAGMAGMDMSIRSPRNGPGVKMGPGLQMITPMPVDRTGERGQGLESVGHRVLVYRDLVALAPNPDTRPPSRALDIRLTGNMERFMWGFDGRKFSETTKPYAFRKGERVRVTLINDTMMAHPIHLHGHFFDLVQGPPGLRPRKHTVIVLPGGKVAWDFTPEAGDWAFHCHMLYHMHAGMFQVFSVRPLGGETA
ncbi:MAG TPA: copper resistance system multicopper oxidase [Caulobacteraceae bacterium]|nr:copper resistance system multicopper oxidase [Caulobacteraceae bacterium]